MPKRVSANPVGCVIENAYRSSRRISGRGILHFVQDDNPRNWRQGNMIERKTNQRIESREGDYLAKK
jgi:hypothetical protein